MNLMQLLRRYAGMKEEGKEEPPTIASPLSQPTSLRAEGQPLASPDNWPDPWRELFEERAAIMEFEGGLGRAEAEQEAGRLLGESH